MIRFVEMATGMYEDQSKLLRQATPILLRYGKWKLAVGGISCDSAKASFNCSRPQLYDMRVAQLTVLALPRSTVGACCVECYGRSWRDSTARGSTLKRK